MNRLAHTTPLTLARVLAEIPTWTDLAPAYCKRLTTMVRAAPRVLDKPAEAIRLDAPGVGARLLKASAAEWGISAKSLPVYRSAVRALLRRLGLIAQRAVAAASMPEPWRQLLALVPPGYDSARIVPFAEFCAGCGLLPASVGTAAVASYMADLDSRLAVRDPRRAGRKLVTAWNGCVASIADWPAPPLVMPPARAKSYTPPFEAYPASFQAEIQALRARLSGTREGGLYAEDGEDDAQPLARPLRPRALTSRMNVLRLVAGALVLSGRPIETITSLGHLVEREALRAICSWHWAHAGRKASSNTGSIAITLRMLARHVARLDEPALRQVIADTAPLIPPPCREITDKNIRRLKQFEDPRKLAALLHLPEQVQQEAEILRERGLGKQAAWMAGVALGIEIELAMPLRLGNLVGLRLGHHLHGVFGRGEMVHVTIPPGEVKNTTTLTFRLGPDAVAMLRRYLTVFRPLGANAEGDFLFPNRDHGDIARQDNGFGRAIGEAVRRHIGARLNAHLFRCLAGVLILRENPDATSDLRLLLGHKSLETTLRFYALVCREQAAERHVARITRLREDSRLLAAATLGGRKIRRGTLSGRGSVR
ncbi:tyrosine-type recombinase/integrase [Falsiroseomonas sp. HC035]|uniref:tyrosine-type recombinase/integrase n=1 Tax=Falsiroseomonas sp. HC035 TaxID=3390999 RepID=UPI003D323B48